MWDHVCSAFSIHDSTAFVHVEQNMCVHNSRSPFLRLAPCCQQRGAPTSSTMADRSAAEAATDGRISLSASASKKRGQ